MLLRNAGPGALAGALAGAICGALDLLLVLRATGAYWVGTFDVLETQAVWGAAGAFAGALAGVALASIAPRAAGGRGFGFRTVTALGLFTGLTGLGWFHLYDVGLPLGSRRQFFPYAACALLAAAIAVATWLLLRRPLRDSRSQRRWLGALSFFLLLPFALRWGTALSESRQPAGPAGDQDLQPSVVLLVLDTTRRDALSIYGNSRRTTPNLDRIAAEGLLFTQAYSVASWTPPSHATLFTGVHPSQHGTHKQQMRLLPDLPTLAETFRDQGYRTHFVSAKQLLTRAEGWTRGFDEAVVANIEDRVDVAHRRVLEHRDRDGSETPTLVDLAHRLLERPGGQPFFLFLNVNDPHARYVPREPYFSSYARDVDRSLVDQERVRKVIASQHGLDKAMLGKIQLNPEEIKLIRAIYDSETAYMDTQLGRFFEIVRELSLSRPMLLLITADHGELLGEHDGLMAHGRFLYQELIHVPLILWGPPSIASGVDHRVVSHVDVFPTLIAAAGIDPQTYPYLAGEDLFGDGQRRAAFAESWPSLDLPKASSGGPIKAVVAGSSKLIWQLQTSEPRLFDLAADNQELQDLAQETATEVRELQQILSSFLDVTAVADQPSPDEKTIRKLKALGYL